MNAALKNDAILIGIGIVAVLLIARNSRSIANGVVTGTGDALVGAAQGIGDAVNDSLINPAVRTITGQPDATLGSWIWDLTHPQDAAALKYGLRLDGSVNYPEYPEYQTPGFFPYY